MFLFVVSCIIENHPNILPFFSTICDCYNENNKFCIAGRGSGGGSGEEEGSSGRGSRRLRDDLRRHTLSSSEHRYAQLRSVDLEVCFLLLTKL